MAILTRSRRLDDRAERAVSAELAQRLAVLLQAGVVPAAAWRHLAASDPTAADVVEKAGDGASIARALSARGAGWRELSAAWSVATTVGAPLAESLRAFSTALRDAVDAADDVGVALAEPAGTAKIMLWLPGVGVLLGAALGVDTVGVLLTDPRGITCLVLGLGFVIGARLWTRALIRRATPDTDLPGIDAELYAIALSGGVAIPRATEIVARATARKGDQEVPEHLRGILDLSRAAGVPAVELLRAESLHARHRSRIDARTRAAQLTSRLLLPLGVCTLPAFLLLGVAPLLLAVLSSTDLPLS